MARSNLERAARLHAIASQFRAGAAQTCWTSYRLRMLAMAQELDLEAARLDGYRSFALR